MLRWRPSEATPSYSSCSINHARQCLAAQRFSHTLLPTHGFKRKLKTYLFTSASFSLHSDYAPKIFDQSRSHQIVAAHCACAHAYTIACYSLYGRFRPLPPSCLLAQWESSCLLRFKFAVQSHSRVIIFLKILFCFSSFSI